MASKLSTIIVGFIIALAAGVTLISITEDFTLEYGINNSALMNDSGGVCSATHMITEINSINALFSNETMNAGTYAPGQKNAPVESNMVTSTQSAGLISYLKLAIAPYTLGKALITDLGCVIGIPPAIMTALYVIFVITIIALLAGIFYFRPI